MSGIAGIYSINGHPVAAANISCMADALARRGPDGQGVWLEGAVGLAHLMFHETPESLQERQPIENKMAQLVITADARIDNREDLIRKLNLTAEVPSEISDSQLIMFSYEKWGEDCVEHLIGDFAFAIWDGHRHVLFCARDYIGIKPFYYCFFKNIFIFASDLNAVICNDDVPKYLSKEMIARYLALDVEDKEITFYEEVRRLPAAHVMRVDRHGLHMRCYWKPDPVREIRLKSDAEYAEAFKEVFAEAIRCRLRSEFPVASMLSGGLDSSSITCMARDILTREGKGRKLITCSAVYDHLPQVDEQRYQDAVIAVGGIEAHKESMKNCGPLEEYIEGQRGMGYPFIGFHYYSSKALFSCMRNQGVRTILSGEGGDDVVSHGQAVPYYLLKRMRLISFCRETIALARAYNRPVSYVMWRLGIRLMIPPVLLSFWQLVRYRKITRRPLLPGDSVIASDLLKVTQVLERAEHKEKESRRMPSTFREGHATVFSSGLSSFIFETFDNLGSLSNLAIRYPFYDRRLAEFCLSLPDDQKLSKGWERSILRRAMAGVLPAEIQWRRDKSNLEPHLFYSWRGKERELLLQTLETVSPALSGYVDTAKLRKCCEDFLSTERKSMTYLSFWPAITLGIFLACRNGLHEEKVAL